MAELRRGIPAAKKWPNQIIASSTATPIATNSAIRTPPRCQAWNTHAAASAAEAMRFRFSSNLTRMFSSGFVAACAIRTR